MTWLVDNDAYAFCIHNTCNPSSNKPYAFTFDFDEAAGKFKLTIGSANTSHDGLIFTCTNGSHSDTVSFNVTPGNYFDFVFNLTELIPSCQVILAHRSIGLDASI